MQQLVANLCTKKLFFLAYLVDVAAQMADQWAKEDKKETARNKSDESLGNLINGEHIFFSIEE